MDKAIFLDRDGVINEVLTDRVTFVNTPEDFHLLPGTGEAVQLLNAAGYKVFVVTNQGGVGLGFMAEEALREVHMKMQEVLRKENALIDDIAYCPHKPYANCACRKPKPQMILDLAEKHQVNLKESYMVGDREPDILAGRDAGVRTILVGNGDSGGVVADFVFPDLLAAAKWIAS
ncbi:D-glycero-alpha-D-manno-heptose-1,7-bisphosphate 7-phosphatase [Virgibacillus xinjiangensis]|uniref:D,D-heptose 1,7-bisphosphate phosphatase n=1 Tax=Virgibacillus xinjiangensis TaxID=393090 RepID=A0ABV7CXC2_9BACI